MQPKFPLAAITDEYSPDLERALDAMEATGMTGAELRVLLGKNILDLTDDQLGLACDLVASRGMKVVSIASPLLKCVLPGGGSLDPGLKSDTFRADHSYSDQGRLMSRAMEIAKRAGAGIIRVFSGHRTMEPERCFDAIVEMLSEFARLAQGEGIVIGLENEHTCNVATATETAAVLKAVSNSNLQVVWDPANAQCAGEEPFPYGYRLLPPDRIAHVHAKDCRIQDGRPVWVPLGTGLVDWKGQIAALLADGYKGYLSLETHWPGPAGNKFEASVICGWNLRGLAAA